MLEKDKKKISFDDLITEIKKDDNFLDEIPLVSKREVLIENKEKIKTSKIEVENYFIKQDLQGTKVEEDNYLWTGIIILIAAIILIFMPSLIMNQTGTVFAGYPPDPTLNLRAIVSQTSYVFGLILLVKGFINIMRYSQRKVS